jgi:hypothetical protein
VRSGSSVVAHHEEWKRFGVIHRRLKNLQIKSGQAVCTYDLFFPFNTSN